MQAKNNTLIEHAITFIIVVAFVGILGALAVGLILSASIGRLKYCSASDGGLHWLSWSASQQYIWSHYLAAVNY